MPPLSSANMHSMDVDQPIAGRRETPAISLTRSRTEDVGTTAEGSGGHADADANTHGSDRQSQRLPPMSLTDLPSPFALPTPTISTIRDGILSGAQPHSASASNEAGP